MFVFIHWNIEIAAFLLHWSQSSSSGPSPPLPAGGALPSGPVLLPVQTPERRRRAPPPSPVTHGCRSGSDRRAHLGGTGDRRLGGGEDRPVRVHRWSLRSAGERCADRASPRAAPLEKLRSFIHRDTFLLSPLSPSSWSGTRREASSAHSASFNPSLKTEHSGWLSVACTQCGGPGSCSSCCRGCCSCRPGNSSRRRSRGDSLLRESWISVMCPRDSTRLWPTTSRVRSGSCSTWCTPSCTRCSPTRSHKVRLLIQVHGVPEGGCGCGRDGM